MTLWHWWGYHNWRGDQIFEESDSHNYWLQGNELWRYKHKICGIRYIRTLINGRWLPIQVMIFLKEWDITPVNGESVILPKYWLLMRTATIMDAYDYKKPIMHFGEKLLYLYYRKIRALLRRRDQNWWLMRIYDHLRQTTFKYSDSGARDQKIQWRWGCWSNDINGTIRLISSEDCVCWHCDLKVLAQMSNTCDSDH